MFGAQTTVFTYLPTTVFTYLPTSSNVQDNITSSKVLDLLNERSFISEEDRSIAEKNNGNHLNLVTYMLLICCLRDQRNLAT